MGEAKRRGTREERAAEPKGDSWNTWAEKYWTPERRAAFKESLSSELKKDLDKIRADLFHPRKKKSKRFRQIKTGG